MDIQNHCNICSDLFDEGSKLPRTLSCGHNLCHTCLEKVLVRSPFCPTCRKDIKLTDAELIPLNLSIKQLALDKKTNDKGDLIENEKHLSLPEARKFLSEGSCEEHGNSNELRCMKCKVWICSMCAILYHKKHRTLLVQEALSEMKKGCCEKVEKQLSSQKKKCEVINDNLTSVNEKREKLKKELQKYEVRAEKLMQEKLEAEDFCSKLELLERSVIELDSYGELTEASEMLQTLMEEASEAQNEASSDPSVQDLIDMSENGMICVVSHNGIEPQYGRAVIENDEVWISSFGRKTPSFNNILTLQEISILRNLHIPQNPHTQRAYLKIAAVDQQFSVVIRTDNLGNRALNFLYLCSGIKGISYKGIHLESYAQGYYTPQHQLRDSAVITKMPRPKSYPVKRGNIGGMNEYKAWFYIEMKDHPTATVPNKFGEVETGLDLLEAAWQEKQHLQIVECGLVF